MKGGEKSEEIELKHDAEISQSKEKLSEISLGNVLTATRRVHILCEDVEYVFGKSQIPIRFSPFGCHAPVAVSYWEYTIRNCFALLWHWGYSAETQGWGGGVRECDWIVEMNLNWEERETDIETF